MMKQVLGLSAFGLNDCAANSRFICHSGTFFLSDAVLPSRSTGRILTGLEAKESRIHTGLHWPVDARIEPGDPLRRAPIPCVWRALVEAGDRTVSWNAGNSVNVPLARILVEHFGDLTYGIEPEEIRGDDILPVAAIPDHLDEFGQEQLLREMKKSLGWKKPHLIWRPVAAALAWLSEVEGDFTNKLNSKYPDSHIHVVYLGPDAFEFSTLRLRVKEHKNQIYVLPRRDRPMDPPLQMTGMDWVGQVINEMVTDIEPASFWQAFTNFPEVWEAVAGRPFKSDELPRPWSRGGNWTLWQPSEELKNRSPKIKVSRCQQLRNIVQASCELSNRPIDCQGTVEEYLSECIQSMAKSIPEGKLQGLIICGPLAPKKMPEWLEAEMGTLQDKGLFLNEDLSVPQIGSLWMPDEQDNPIARGAAIYGERILAGVPAYLDTLPQLAMLAYGRGRHIWVPLLDAQEATGGEEYSVNKEKLFQLNAGQTKLHAYLFKGSREGAPEEAPDLPDTAHLSLQGVSPCRARLIRFVIRQMKDLKQFEENSFFQKNTNEARYGRDFADVYFTQDENKEETESDDSKVNISTPFRKTVFEFPSSPARDELIDVSVRIRPASGLARVELKPKDASFLEGERVRLNYDRMRRTENLPKRKRGWPRIQEWATDPSDSNIIAQNQLVEIFEGISINNERYLNVLDQIQGGIFKGASFITYAHKQFYVRNIDQNGTACTKGGKNMVQRIINKLETDFHAVTSQNFPVNFVDKMVGRITWLYTSTPLNVLDYLRKNFKYQNAPSRFNRFVEAAGRSFDQPDDFAHLFWTIRLNTVKREYTANGQEGNTRTFPINSQRAICSALMYRQDSEKHLNCETAMFFARHSLERLRAQERQQNFERLYFQLIRLLLYLLRCRRSNPSCFDPNDERKIRPFLDAIESMKNAKDYLGGPGQNTRAQKVNQILKGFERYVYYEGSEETLVQINELAENT